MTQAVAVIGAGGAGLLAGLAAARHGARTILYERMPTPGKKVAISGGGRCNFTNILPPREFVREFGDPHVKYLGHALRVFSQQDVIELLGRHGVQGQVERHYRLYTASGRGRDVVDVLAEEYRAAGGELLLNARVTNLAPLEGPGFALTIVRDGTEITHQARAVVVCTGGLSYPQTGSTGDGYDWARATRHRITELKPALTGLLLDGDWPQGISGTSWPDAEATLWACDPSGRKLAKKPLCRERKEILFTHFGISGPAILDVSNFYVHANLDRALLELDFHPERTRESLDADVTEALKAQPRRKLAHALEAFLPKRLLAHLETRAGLPPETPAGRCTKSVRLWYVEQMKALRLQVSGTRGMAYGEVTAGGLAWEDLNPATLESLHQPGLFFAGEMLDLAGRCGGFNLQAAFSTGYLAGREAARYATTSPTDNPAT
jgi:predicted Rossmann fold flavoprotein